MFDAWATFGVPLHPDLVAGGPPLIGAARANISAELLPFAQETARDEAGHVRCARARLVSGALRARLLAFARNRALDVFLFVNLSVTHAGPLRILSLRELFSSGSSQIVEDIFAFPFFWFRGFSNGSLKPQSLLHFQGQCASIAECTSKGSAKIL
jgi:hypothetical protein